ncbi:multicopper oxidase family protein [Paenibacillus barengoltzii]|uniref:multicopper oxidase family protein n=1 Tax=Paenibacillus barengoltzii TaxID=343517 RepID=UPI000FDC9D12|nr:multicopper oxidase family protein [Paenibacillus barengoltzii]
MTGIGLIWKKTTLWIAGFVVLLLLASCGYNDLRFPEEVDMSQMHHGAANGSHESQEHEGHATSGPGASAAAVSCTELKEAQPAAGEQVRGFALTAAKSNLTLDNGKQTEAWTFNGTTPGPELRVQEGERVRVTLTNQDIDKGVTIHWHGVILPCSQDGVAGVTQDAVWPGEQFTYEFIARYPGTYWYHSHQQSSEQAGKGLIGRLIVEPKQQAFKYDRDYAVTLQLLNEKWKLTNGHNEGVQLDAAPGETVRLRLINAYSEVQWIGVAGAEFQVISMDGQDLNGPGMLREQWIPIGGGQRYDVLFTMPASGQVKVYSKEHKAWNIRLGSGPTPEALSKDAPDFDFTNYGTPLDDGISSEMKFDRVYDLKLGILDINGKKFHEIPPILVKEGEWIKIRFKHTFGGPHPMHLHGHVFKILTKNGKPLTGSPIYADSVLLFSGEEYEVAFQADNPGLWMEHCHNLGHAANGMTMMVNYEGLTTPYRVGTKSGNLPD